MHTPPRHLSVDMKAIESLELTANNTYLDQVTSPTLQIWATPISCKKPEYVLALLILELHDRTHTPHQQSPVYPAYGNLKEDCLWQIAM